jgi:hypothetical protein
MLGTTAVGEFWFNEENTRRQPPYGLLYARAGWSNDRFEVAFIGRNMLQKHYYANALDLGPGFGFVGTPGDPATFGVTASFQF